jgi:hypothetical protein
MEYRNYSGRRIPLRRIPLILQDFEPLKNFVWREFKGIKPIVKLNQQVEYPSLILGLFAEC